MSSTPRLPVVGAAAAVLLILSPQTFAWGPMHAAITEGAYNALPEWQRELLAGQRQKLIEFDCIIPDLVRAPANRKMLGRFGNLPNGDPFTHEPHSRHHNYDQMLHYFSQAVAQVKGGDLDEASRYAGCLLHFLEDCGSPAHSIPGDNQHGLMKDLIPIPEAYKDRPLHGLIENGTLKIELGSYRPKLLGTTSPEAVSNLVERMNYEVRNARAQVIPILQGVFQNAQEPVDAARRKAATVDGEVAADALYTILSIAKNRFEDADKAQLEKVDLVALTPLEVISQAYFPQNTYYSNPFFGYPTPNGVLKDGIEKQPLVLNVMENGATAERAFEHGLGVGTHTRLTYSLPEKVYDRFECYVGLHPKLGVQGSVAFRVYADGEAVFESGILTGLDPARRVVLPVWRVNELSIEVEGRGTQVAGKNYAIIADPLLFKAAGPPKLDQEAVK